MSRSSAADQPPGGRPESAPEPNAGTALQALSDRTTAGDDLCALAAALRAQHGEGVAAVLYYGSCLRAGNAGDGIADFYVLVDRYRDAGMGWLRAGLNRLLPPNVFYLETSWQHTTLRAKYAVISVAQFQHGVTGGWWLPYLWGRFAQPSGVLWCREPALEQSIYAWLEHALQYFVSQCAPLLPASFDAEQLWQTGLSCSYRTELRAERSDRILGLFAYWPDYYRAQTQRALSAAGWLDAVKDGQFQVSIPAAPRRRCRWRWRARIAVGKPLALLRLIKSLLTFRGALDYAVWKIERHSGQQVALPGYARRWPLLGGWVVLWQLLRRGSLR